MPGCRQLASVHVILLPSEGEASCRTENLVMVTGPVRYLYTPISQMCPASLALLLMIVTRTNCASISAKV